ncbi:MAG: Ig-like domain-containing protein, partial [Acidobacteriota bacterium]
RPPDRAAAENPDHWALRSSFDGLDVLGDPASGVALKTGSAAFYQENSERVVNVRFTGSVAAMINPETNQPLVEHVQELDTNGLVDEFGNTLDPTIPTPVVERVPVHVGGLVDGRVVRGTGDPVPGAKVQLIRPRWVETLKGPKIKLDLAGTTTTDDDGRFFFEYVENPNWDRQVDRSFVLRATVPAGDDPELEPEEIQEVSSVIRQQNRMAHVNIALLGRGHLTGKLVYLDDQSPAKKGRVTAASTLFREEKTVQIEADGSFRIPGMPVGPITLTGRDDDGRKVYATVGIAEPGDTVDVHLEIQRQTAPVGEGSVVGRVMQRRDGELYPATGARVACYSEGRIIGSQTTDDDGLFRFDGVPEGRVSVQARDWRISRTAAFTDLILTDGEIAEVELVLFDGGRKTVTGEVFFRDPFTQELIPIEGAVAFIGGPGNFAYTDASGRYTIEDVPTQGVSDNPWQLTVIDFERQLQGRVGLPPILENTPDPIVAQSIVLEEMEGSVSGVVLDPLGRPAAGVGVVLLPYAETFTGPDGSFLFEDIPTGSHTVTAHSGDGLTPGRVGWIGAAKAEVVFGGHRPFVQIRMRGAGKVRLKTRTATSTGILTPIFWRPTYYSETAKAIVLAGAFTEDTTDPNGNLELDLPVGEFEIVAFNPFHGIKEINGQIEYAGQVKDLDILFEDAATVKGVVVDVDGVTPVPDVEVELHTKTLLPQKQRTNALGEFQYELVPEGPIEVRARGFVGTVERVGRTLSGVQLGGYTYELTVQMKAQGTVKGQVKETVNGTTTPLAFARYFVRENSYPFRRIPQDGSFLLTDDQGRYQVSHVYAGRVTVVAQDSFQVTRQGSTNGEITADWQVATMDDIVMKTSVGRLEVLVRDPDTGGPVADTQIRLSNKEWTTTGADGVGVFEALPLGSYSIYAFHAPTGRAGRQSGLKLTGGGQTLKGTVFLDIRGEVRGTLYDDAAKTTPVPGGIVRLVGFTPSGRVEGLATTSGRDEALGRFSFGGIPEGQYSLTAALQSSPRRASASVGITDTAPIADIDMVLEPIGDLYFRLYEKLTAGTTPLAAENGLFSVRVTQASVAKPRAKAYDFTRLAPEPGTDLFYFPDVLTGRGVSVTAQEQGAELRKASLSISKPLDPPSSVQGDGSAGDPFRLTLSPKGAVRITVLDGGGELLEGANVTLWTSGGRFPSVTGDEGTVVFRSVPAGGLTAYAENPFTGFGGTTRSRLDFDDQTVEILVQLQPAVSASGRIFAPTADDRPPADASELVPAPGMIVTLRDSQNDQHLVFTDDDGFYRFPVLPTGGYALTAQDNNGTQKITFGGSLSGPNGNENVIPDLILDASPPRVVSITPPPGIEGVSRLAPVEIVFTEPLATNILPGSGGNRYYTLISANGIQPTGVWSHRLDGGRQVIRFVPSSPYENETTYTLTIDGESNGVKDRAGRQLTQFGNVGANFTTSDSVGPTVIGTEPTLERPVDPTVPLRIDFSEGLSATDELLDGDGVDDAATLEVLKGDGTWVELPVVLFLTRQGYSLQVEPIQGLEIPDDTLRRRLTVTGLLDSVGNPMNPWVATFRIYDENTPGLAIGPPANAPDGQLVQGVSYTLQPVLSNLDDLDLGPGGDIDSVDYFFEDPEDPTSPVQPNFSAREHPFTYTFVGAYAGDGIEPRLFPVWVRVVDTSTNASDFVKVDMQVLPNTPPTIDGALLDVLSPIAGTLYAGSTVRATADGIDDVDGSRLTVSLAVFREDEALPIGETGGVLILRPDGGWDTLDPPFQSFTIDLDVPEGTPIYSRVRVIDSQGAIAEVESERVLVADDTEPPTVDSVVARRVADNSPQLVFFIGETLRLEWRARDGETDVSSVEVTFDRDDIFPAPITATRVSGDLFRTEVLSVPPDLFFEPTSVVATIAADDYGGNTGERTLTFEVAPEPDPTAPVATWRSPWQGGEWPAAYESTTLTGATDLLLRAWITDISLDDADQEVPGTIVDVRFRGPVQTADGGFELAEQWAAAELV